MNGKTLCAQLEFVAREEPQRIAIETWREGRQPKRLSYCELFRRVGAASDFIASQIPAGPKEPIGVVLDASFATHIAIHAVMRLGHAALLLDPHWGCGTAATVLAHSGASAVIGSPPADWDLGRAKAISLIEMHAWPAEQSMEDRSMPDTVAVLAYTSGSTSEPKGVPLTHRNLLCAYQLGRSQLGLPDGCRMGCLLRVASLGTLGMQFFFAQVHRGTTVLLPEIAFVNVPAVIATAKLAKLDYLYVVPAVLRWINKRCAPGSLDQRCLYGVAGAPLEPADARGFRTAFAARLRNMYGLTECSFAIFFGRADPEVDCTSIGAAIGLEADIVDSTGVSLAVGQLGEIVVSGPFVSEGYLANGRAARETFAGKWFRTGDLGTRDERGFFHVRGRAKEMVIRGGFNIYYVEVEEWARKYPGVIDCAAFKVKDPVKDEKLLLLVLADITVCAADLRQFLALQLGTFRAPDEIVVQSDHALPLNRAGKVDRAGVAKLFEALRENSA
jgi:long-chain acyl-CoA synthetase